jgi:hypothetical protein
MKKFQISKESARAVQYKKSHKSARKKMLNIIRPKESSSHRTASKYASKKPPEPEIVVSPPMKQERNLHITVDAEGKFVGVPEEWQHELAAVFSLNKIDKTPENLDKAANVAQTSFKLRLKNRFPKGMRLVEREEGDGTAAVPAKDVVDEEKEGPRLRKNMPVAEIMAEIRALCRTDSIYKQYRMVGGHFCYIYLALDILLSIFRSRLNHNIKNALECLNLV